MKKLLLIFSLLLLSSCSANVEPDTGVSGRWQGLIQSDSVWDVDIYIHLESASGGSSHGIGDIEYYNKAYNYRLNYSAEIWAYGSERNLDVHIQPGQDVVNPRWTLAGRVMDSGRLCLYWERDKTRTYCLDAVDVPPFNN